MLRSDCRFAVTVMCFLSFLKTCKVHSPISKDNIFLPHVLFQEGYFPKGSRKKSFTTLFKKYLATCIFPESTVYLRGECLTILENGNGENLALPALASIFHTLP